MNILINFATLKIGGGQNVALNFLNEFQKIVKNNTDKYFFIVAKNSAIHKKIDSFSKNYCIVPQKPINRIIYELIVCRRFILRNNIDIIYSYFGYGMYNLNIPQVVGAAVSNILCPDIDFWKDYSIFQRIKHRLVDQYRLYGLKKAKGLIFENSFLENQFNKLYNKKNKKLTITILPSIDFSYKREEFSFGNENMKYGLFLCGWHLNKNIMMIPLIAKQLKDKGIKFHFIFTAPDDNSNLCLKFKSLEKKYDVEDMISLIGNINKEKIPCLYEKIDIIFLLSYLESFSNNIIEAWRYKKPLIISDEQWSHNICNDAASYVNRDDAENIAERIIYILKNKKYTDIIVSNGENELKKYPIIEQKTKAEINFIKKVYEYQ